MSSMALQTHSLASGTLAGCTQTLSTLASRTGTGRIGVTLEGHSSAPICLERLEAGVTSPVGSLSFWPFTFFSRLFLSFSFHFSYDRGAVINSLFFFPPVHSRLYRGSGSTFVFSSRDSYIRPNVYFSSLVAFNRPYECHNTFSLNPIRDV